MKRIKREIEELVKERGNLFDKQKRLEEDLAQKKKENKLLAQEEVIKNARINVEFDKRTELFKYVPTGYNIDFDGVRDRFGSSLIWHDDDKYIRANINIGHKDPATFIQSLHRIAETFEFVNKNTDIIRKSSEYYARLLQDEDYLNLRLSIWLLLAKWRESDLVVLGKDIVLKILKGLVDETRQGSGRTY